MNVASSEEMTDEDALTLIGLLPPSRCVCMCVCVCVSVCACVCAYVTMCTYVNYVCVHVCGCGSGYRFTCLWVGLRECGTRRE